ncbi:MAG: hypothetical protein ACI841_002401, partial [Planctomycetota bacterium]
RLLRSPLRLEILFADRLHLTGSQLRRRSLEQAILASRSLNKYICTPVTAFTAVFDTHCRQRE